VVVLGLSFAWGVVYHVTRDSGNSERTSDRKRRW